MTGRRLVLIGCPLLAFVLHLPALGCGFVFDDRGAILLNPLLQHLSDLPRLVTAPYWNAPGHTGELYRPLTSVSFAVDGAISGMRPAWFHFVNILLHAAATALVTLLALRLLRGEALGAAVAGGIFAVHPAHVEAVAGIVGRSEILAALGVLAAILCHRRALAAPGRSGFWWMGATWGALGLGLLSKESAIVAPLLCVLAERVWDVRGAAGSRRGILYAGHAACILAYLAARVGVLGSLGPGRPIPFVDNPAAAAGAIDGRLTGLGTLVRYARLLVWPRQLSADYSFDQIPVIHSALDPRVFAALLMAASMIGAGAWLLARGRASGFAILFVVVTMSLTCNVLFFIGTLLAERLLYLPSAGAALVAGCITAGATRKWARRAALALAAAMILGLAARTWARLPDWKDDLSLYTSAARVSPRSARIRYNVGNVYLRMASYREAEEHYRAALALYPDFLDARVNLAMALVQQGRAGEALGGLEQAAASHPDSADIALNLGTAYRALGDAARAEGAFRRCLSLDPTSSRAWNNLGSLALQRDEPLEAIADLEKAVGIEPSAPLYHVNLADALNAAGRSGPALDQFEIAARLDPTLPEARRGLGEVALARKDFVTAEREFRAASSAIQPSARAANFLGYVLSRKGEYSDAAAAYERALALDPGLADAHKSLGILYGRRLGERDKAIAHLRASLDMDPRQAQAGDLRRLLLELEKAEKR